MLKLGFSGTRKDNLLKILNSELEQLCGEALIASLICTFYYRLAHFPWVPRACINFWKKNKHFN
ncbi:hypothetical protein Tsubulata_026609, partial [Turnera subulata]